MAIVFKILFWVLVVGYAGVCVVGWRLQDRLVFQPSRDRDGDPGDVGLPYGEVWLDSRDPAGRPARVHAWWLPVNGARATVLFCHGNAGNITHRLNTLLILHRLRVSVLIFDYQGYGRSEGEPGEAATANDVRAAWDWLTQEKGEAPRHIVLMGRSLGGAVAARLAAAVSAEGRAPGGLILESTFTSLPAVGQRMYPWLPVRWLARSRFETLAALTGGAVRCPVLVIHSAEDELVPFQMGQRLLEAYMGPKTFLQITGGHNEGFLEAGAVYTSGLDDFFMRLP